MQLPRRPYVTVKYDDITMFMEDMGVLDILLDHPDPDNFVSQQFTQGQIFGIIMCEGSVCQTQSCTNYRELEKLDNWLMRS